MRKFDCLSLNCPILGPHLLEASAGTGKTFSIEHIVVRLLSEMELEEILVVTFTRAATRELKNRIKSNIEKAIQFLQNGNASWEYLKFIEDPDRALRLFLDAQALFDRSQIFTIHGFCYRMLKEFAFEANLGFSLSSPDQGLAIPKRLWRAALKFLREQIDPTLLCPEQIAVLLKKYDSLEDLAEILFVKQEGTLFSFLDAWREYKTILSQWEGGSIEGEKLQADFESISMNYKAVIKGDFENQVSSLAKSFIHLEDPIYFRNLLREKGSLFYYLSLSNQKVKVKEPQFLHYPHFFTWAEKMITPVVDRSMKEKNILYALRSAWKVIADPISDEEEYLDPDEILNRMGQAVQKEAFSSCVRKKYKAVIVDEFQDTDPVQWHIFRSLFLEQSNPLTAFYLVGDPKQSIYRFRKADVYTYFEARDFLGEEFVYRLDTNFRSSKKLIGALNALFSRNWLPLPKLQKNIISLPVIAGLETEDSFNDEKGAIHFMIAEGGQSLFEEVFLPYAVGEIERLSKIIPSFSSYAILVKDRYQAKAALELCQKRSIPAIAKSHMPLGKTFAFKALFELFKAIACPRDLSIQRIVQLGPFHFFSFNGAKILLEKGGLNSFFHICFSSSFDTEFENDLRQIAEQLLIWESVESFSFQGLFRFLNEFKQLDPSEGGRRCLQVDQDAVQILTLHISKGLEFEVVFALGLASRTPEAEEIEELDAEKLRQLYVAMTRSKLRLYVPFGSSEKTALEGTLSPVELFTQTVESQEGAFLSFLEKLSYKESITFERLETPFKLDSPQNEWADIPSKKHSLITVPPYESSLLLSFTSLAQENHFSSVEEGEISTVITREEFTAHTLVKGKETGIFIHEIFESLFSSLKPLWKDLSSVKALVEDRIKNSFLMPWKEAIIEMIWKTLTLPLKIEQKYFSLIDLEVSHVQTEMEFLFESSPHFIKGFIDLVFFFDHKYYIVDWKTNWLGPDSSCYVVLDEAMTAHDYWLQAALYSEALCRHVKQFDTSPFEKIFGGVFYFFVRGGGVCHFTPDLNLIKKVTDEV